MSRHLTMATCGSASAVTLWSAGYSVGRVVVRSWAELEVGKVYYLRGPERTFRMELTDKEWATRSLWYRVRTEDVFWFPNRLGPYRIFNVHRLIAQGLLRTKP